MNLSTEIATRSTKKVYRDGDACIKVFNNNYKKADVLNEALNQARIEETGLNIPGVREVAMIDGKWAIVSDFIEGKTLAELISENPAKKDEYLEQLCDLQIEMQRHTARGLNKLKDKMNEKLLAADINATERYELRTRLESMPKHVKVCHGDFNPSNVVIDKNGKAFILDWAHATQGNASGDVATTYLLLSLSYDEATAKKYLTLFCEKTDTAMQYVQKWIPVAAAALSLKYEGADKAYLLKLSDVVEYE